MICLKLSQAGEIVNHKRIDWLYAKAGLQVKKRKRKKIPLAERPLWSARWQPTRCGRWTLSLTARLKGAASRT